MSSVGIWKIKMGTKQTVLGWGLLCAYTWKVGLTDARKAWYDLI